MPFLFLLPLVVLAAAGCTSTIELKHLNFDRVEGKAIRLVAELDRDLEKEYPGYTYFLRYAVLDPDQTKAINSTPGKPLTTAQKQEVEKIGTGLLNESPRDHFTLGYYPNDEGIRQALEAGGGAFRALRESPKPPFLYEIYLPYTVSADSRGVGYSFIRGEPNTLFLSVFGREATFGWFPCCASAFESNVRAQSVELPK
jgi:hypothetical protein